MANSPAFFVIRFAENLQNTILGGGNLQNKETGDL